MESRFTGFYSKNCQGSTFGGRFSRNMCIFSCSSCLLSTYPTNLSTFQLFYYLLTKQLNMSYDKHYLGEHVMPHSSKSSSCLIAAQLARKPCFPWFCLLLKYTYAASTSCKTKRSLLCLDLNRAIAAHQLFKLSPHHSRSYQRDFLSGNLCRT